ncbi:MAG: EamA family transporter, partial [Acidimicrobiia bacterium]|nr:EamA family transporter [Acidimicrobiia bacterium]
ATAFAVFFIAMGQTSEGSALWPLAAARAVSIPVAFLVIFTQRSFATTPKGAWLLVAVSGMIDMAANIAILLAVQRGPLGINAVLGSLYPVFTVGAAVVFLQERPTTRQVVGIAGALVAIAFLAI